MKARRAKMVVVKCVCMCAHKKREIVKTRVHPAMVVFM